MNIRSVVEKWSPVSLKRHPNISLQSFYSSSIAVVHFHSRGLLACQPCQKPCACVSKVLMITLSGFAQYDTRHSSSVVVDGNTHYLKESSSMKAILLILCQ